MCVLIKLFSCSIIHRWELLKHNLWFTNFENIYYINTYIFIDITNGNLSRTPEEKWIWGELIEYVEKRGGNFWLGRLLENDLMIKTKRTIHSRDNMIIKGVCVCWVNVY